MLSLVLVLSLTGCGSEKETSMAGIVVSVNGTVVSLQKIDAEMQSGERPEMPNGEKPDMGSFEGQEGFEDFDPENFDPADFDGTMPEPPEGAEPPENTEMPDFSARFSEGESTEIDLADAHISLEIDGGKAAGSMEDIKTGAFLTVTLDKNGNTADVVVSSGADFGFGKDGSK